MKRLYFGEHLSIKNRCDPREVYGKTNVVHDSKAWLVKMLRKPKWEAEVNE
jgi:hypothetical protein